MHERRNEPFRYPFQVPLPGYYSKKFSRHISGPLQVDDISLNGLRFSCDLNPGLTIKDEVFLSFIFENETYTAEGRIIWLKTDAQRADCGVRVFEFPDRLRGKIQELGNSLMDEKNLNLL